MFRELLGKSEAETSARIDAAWRQLTTGDEENERLYYPAPNDTAYIADIGDGVSASDGEEWISDRRDAWLAALVKGEAPEVRAAAR